MKTLLLCGYRSSQDHDEDPVGVERGEDGLTLIDRRIAQLKGIGLEPVCVLAGNTADEQLRRCRGIAAAELVFDDTKPQVSLTTNILSGLLAYENEACYVLPAEIPCPPISHFEFLKHSYLNAGSQGQISLIQAVDAQGAPWHFGFPLLITRFGNKELRRLPGLTSLTDTRLNYLHVEFGSAPNLASDLKAI